MILAELVVRHTRKHMPTRRVALGDLYLPMTGGGAHGAGLLAAVVAETVAGLDEEQAEDLPRLLHDVLRRGISVPSIALRYRLQTDVHGLDRSRHRLLEESGRIIAELDVHGAPVPQVIGAVMAAGMLGSRVRRRAVKAIEAAVAQPGVIPEPFVVRRLLEGIPILRPPVAGMGPVAAAYSDVSYGDGGGSTWVGIPAERRWAMEVLGLGAGVRVDGADVRRRFRRLLRLAHPDQGGAADAAAERIAELSEARDVLMTDPFER